MSLFRKLFSGTTPHKRMVFFITADLLIFILSIYISYAIKFGLKPEVNKMPYDFIIRAIELFLVIKFLVFYFMRLYQFTWQYVGLHDLYNLLKAATLSSGIILAIYLAGYSEVAVWLPKSVILMDYFITFILVGSLRISKRIFMEVFRSSRQKTGRRTLIIGADHSGEMIMRDMMKNNFIEYHPIAFLDTDEKKWNTYIHSIPVLGDPSMLEKVVKAHDITALIIAGQNITLKATKDLFTTARRIGIKEIKIIPKLYSLTNLEVSVKRLEDIHVEDLINRQEIRVETEKISQFIKNKRILITGAAGSIGSEIVRQALLFHPAQLVLLEIDETEVFHLERQLLISYPESATRVIYLIGDVRDADKVRSVFENYRPEIVFSTAAYKHVPLMEHNPDEAIKVNIFGTYNLCQAAHDFGVQKYINISTDKAVKPESVMGITKRYGEYVARAFNDHSPTQYISVRFGNVLGSRGSVVPVFLEQIRRGGPVTVTDPEMKRYFMTIPEAVTLVLQAALLGKGGEVMVLDMGEPIYVNKLAEELIRLHGLLPGKDIEITYTGVRPGEKLFEEILTAEEGTSNTAHERVYTAIISQNFSLDQIQETLGKFRRMLNEHRESSYIKTELLVALREARVNDSVCAVKI
jgi:FlaA1/EpsC-like NDP-sugar epimerase